MNPNTITPAVLRRALLGLGAAAVLIVGTVAATAWSSVEVLADGEVHEVRMTSGTVADALDDAAIDLASDDDVHPDLDTEVAGDLQIVVTRAITVEVVVDDEEPVTVTAPVASVDGAVRLAGFADLRARGAVATPTWQDTISDGDVISIRRPVEVTLEADGDERTVVTLAAQVEDLLSLNDVELGPDDRVSPAPWSALRADQTITVERVEYVETTDEVVLPRDEVRRETSSLDRGRTRIEDEGRDGLRRDEYLVTIVDGEEVERELLGGEVVLPPRDRVVLVGTRAPAPAGAVSASSSVWDRLAQCESGGNWQINTGNGYYGGLQFLPQTWRSVGGSGLPHQASKAEQIHRAQILQARSGWGQWPACSRKLGLR